MDTQAINPPAHPLRRFALDTFKMFCFRAWLKHSREYAMTGDLRAGTLTYETPHGAVKIGYEYADGVLQISLLARPDEFAPEQIFTLIEQGIAKLGG